VRGNKMADGGFAAKYEVPKDQWGNIIRVQIHFNELIHRTRQLTATVVLATYGASAAFFASHPKAMWELGIIQVHITTPLIILGFAFILVGLFTDRGYYFDLLLASVKAGEDIEKEFDLPAKLTLALSEAIDRRKAKITVYAF
jgi:hypothetical protein